MKIRKILIIVPFVLLVLALAMGSVLLWRIFVLAVLTLLLGYLWMRLSIRGIGGRVNKSIESCQAGDYFDEEITITNSSRLPAPLMKVEEETNLPGHHNTVALGLASLGSHKWRTSVYCPRRGRYHLGVLNASISDPFGFFSLNRRFGEQQEITVYPETVELPFFQPLTGTEARNRYQRWSVTGTAPEVARVREYVGGDSLNRIHWHSTAHTGQLMVKVFDPERPRHIPQNKNVWVILNMQQASQLGEGEENTAEYSIILAASLAKKYLEGGKPVGLMAEGDRPYLFLQGTGEQHLGSIMEALALMKATGSVPLDRLIIREIDRLEASSAAIVITPAASEGLTAALRPVISRGTNVIAMLLDPPSFGGGVSSFKTASALATIGAQVYVIRRGLEIKRVSHSRKPFPEKG